MTINERHFIGFIRYAIMGGDYPHGILTKAGWHAQQKMAKEQTVNGLFYHAISQMPQELRPPQELLLKLYSKVVYYQEMNKMLNERTCDIFKIYKELGYNPILLKGQEVATYYNHPELRTFGDIDIYVPNADHKLYDWVQQNTDGTNYVPGAGAHLMAFSWNGAIIENHLCLLKFYNKSLAKRMEQIITSELTPQGSTHFVTINNQQIPVLSPTISLLYQIVHFSKHLILSGVGLRQLCDITLMMHRYHKEIDRKKICQWFDLLEIRRMANAVAAAAVRYLGLPSEEVPYQFLGDTYGQKEDDLMEIVMDAGNVGYWKRLGKKQSWWNHIVNKYKQYIRIYPYMPKEVRTEMWLDFFRRMK